MDERKPVFVGPDADDPLAASSSSWPSAGTTAYLTGSEEEGLAASRAPLYRLRDDISMTSMDNAAYLEHFVALQARRGREEEERGAEGGYL